MIVNGLLRFFPLITDQQTTVEVAREKDDEYEVGETQHRHGDVILKTKYFFPLMHEPHEPAQFTMSSIFLSKMLIYIIPLFEAWKQYATSRHQQKNHHYV